MRTLSIPALALALVTAVWLPLTSTTAEAAAATPAATAAPAGQVVTVSTATATSTRATIDLWQLKAGGGYAHVGGPVPGFVGELGVGTAHEGVARTPTGVYGLTQAFGNQPSNGTALPYFQAGPADWWDGESGTSRYNTHVHQSAAPGPASENLYAAGAVYAHAVVIDYNRFPVRAGAGSAFFLHVANGQPTAGCVSMDGAALNLVMRWLKPALHPVIAIGVGANALGPVTRVNTAVAKHNPTGHLDSLRTGHNVVQAAGWAVDPDGVSATVPLRVYVDGRAANHYSTGVARPDVAAAKHIGGHQGFDFSIWLGAGRYTVCVRAENLGLGTNGAVLGCGVVTVS